MHQRSLFAFAFQLVAAFTLAGCTDDRPKIGEAKSAVSGGISDDNNEFPWVAQLTVNDASGGALCTGILISPGLILTANHCIRDWWYQLAEPTVDHSESKWNIKLGAGPEPVNLAISLQHNFQVVHRGVTFTYPISPNELLGHMVDMYSKDEPSQDLAIIRLDQRVPLSQVTPMHVPLLGYPSCQDEYGSDDFDGTLIGFGGCDQWNSATTCNDDARTFNDVGGWGRESDRPVAPFEVLAPLVDAGASLALCAANGGYPTLDMRCVKDLPGGLYSSYWTAPELLNYLGIMAGDSGGPLVSEDTFGNLPGVGNSGGRLLCGVGSRAYPVLPHDLVQPAGPTIVLGNDYVAVDGNNTSWLESKVVRGGNFIGECVLPQGDPLAPFADVDSDNDLIPDACDPCPRFYDHDYDISTTPDTDADGVPDRCDNCPTVPNPLQPYQDPNLMFVTSLQQPDDDQDGYGNVCDTCPMSQLVKVPALPLFPPPPFTDYACCKTDADCQPLSCSGGSPENPAPPVGKLCFPGDSRGNIIDQLQTSGVSFALCENHCAAPLDFDCDKKGDLCDVCPSNFDPAQTDTDSDGVGDVCDNCPGGDVAHSEDLNPTCDYFNPFGAGKLFCESLNPDSVCLPPHPKPTGPSNSDVSRCSLLNDKDADGVGQACDNCASKSNPPDDWSSPGLPQPKQKNCNIVTEIATGVPYPYVGDACDRNPCSNFSAFKEVQTQSHYDQMGWVAEVDYGPRLLPYWEPGEYYGAPFPYWCVPNQHCANPRATTGLRFCSCDQLGPDGKPDALLCNQAGCTLDSNEYYAVSSPWFVPSLLMQGDVSYFPPSNAPYLKNAEVSDQQMINPVPGSTSDFGLLAESTWWTSTAYWYTAPDIAKFGGGESQLTGVLWSHVAWVKDLLSESDAESKYRAWSNHYRGGVFGPRGKAMVQVLVPEMIPLPKWEPVCDPLKKAWPETQDQGTVVVDASASLVGMRSIAGDVELTGATSAAALEALGQPSMWWVGASEFAASPDSAPGLASVSLDGLRVTSVLGTQAGQIVSLVGPEPPPPPSSGGRAGFGTVLSSTEASVFVIGGRDLKSGKFPGDMWRYDVSSRAWSQLAIYGVLPQTVLASVYRAQDGALYVADRTPTQSRLLRIDLSTRRSTLLGAWSPTLTWDRTYLSNTFDGKLLLAASSSATNSFAAVAFDPSTDLSRSNGPSFLSLSGEGTVLVAPTLTQNGLTLAVAQKGLGVKNQFVALTVLSSAPRAHDNLIDQCL